MFEEIISIEEIKERKAIDIEVSGNHLFYANDILTHNSNDDVGLEDTSESFGLPATADLMFALISNEELANNGQMLVKQLKNRYNDLTAYQRFVVGVDRSKMRLYDVDQNDSPLNKNEDNGPAFDNSNSGQRLKSEQKFKDFRV